MIFIETNKFSYVIQLPFDSFVINFALFLIIILLLMFKIELFLYFFIFVLWNITCGLLFYLKITCNQLASSNLIVFYVQVLVVEVNVCISNEVTSRRRPIIRYAIRSLLHIYNILLIKISEYYKKTIEKRQKSKQWDMNKKFQKISLSFHKDALTFNNSFLFSLFSNQIHWFDSILISTLFLVY